MKPRYFSSAVAAFSKLSGGLLAICATACVVSLFLTFSASHEKNVSDFLSGELREARVEEHVVVRGTYMEVLRGEVRAADGGAVGGRTKRLALALAYKKALARYSPFFALPGVDTKRLKAASELLRTTSEHLASVQKTDKETLVVKTALYPAEFIAALVELEDARREFLHSGSDTAANEYDIAFQKTLREYQDGLMRFRLGFQEAVPENVQGYAAMRSLISRSGTLEAIRHMQDTANTISAKSRQRELCITGVKNACSRQDITLQIPTIHNNAQASAKTRRFAKEVQDVFLKTGYAPDMSDGGFLVELSDARCTEAGKTPTPALFTTNQVVSMEGYMYSNIIPLNDIRFVYSEKYKDVPFFGYFHEHNVVYVPITINHYTCPEIGSDRGKVFGTLSVRAFAHETPVYEGVMSKNDILLLRTVRASLLSSVASEKDAVAYLAILSTYHSSMPKSLADELASLALQINRGTGGFEDGVFEVALMENMNARLVATEGPKADLTPAYLFFVRSNALSLFMALHGVGDKSVDDFFEDVGEQATNAPFVRYSALRENWRERERVISDMKAYHEVFSQEL